ncbi:hypothetical protein ABIF86_000299 [Bradyrhizobium japonicum]
MDLPDRRQGSPRRDQVRNVIHLPVDTDVGRCGKRRDDPTRVRKVIIRRREASVDGRDLIRMDRDPADEAVTAARRQLSARLY